MERVELCLNGSKCFLLFGSKESIQSRYFYTSSLNHQHTQLSYQEYKDVLGYQSLFRGHTQARVVSTSGPPILFSMPVQIVWQEEELVWKDQWVQHNLTKRENVILSQSSRQRKRSSAPQSSLVGCSFKPVSTQPRGQQSFSFPFFMPSSILLPSPPYISFSSPQTSHFLSLPQGKSLAISFLFT